MTCYYDGKRLEAASLLRWIISRPTIAYGDRKGGYCQPGQPFDQGQRRTCFIISSLDSGASCRHMRYISELLVPTAAFMLR